MNLYKISQSVNEGYDTYDSAVVCAESEEEARKIHPSMSMFVTHCRDGKWYIDYAKPPYGEYETEYSNYSSWVKNDRLYEIQVEYLGKADISIKKGVIVASFNAG